MVERIEVYQRLTLRGKRWFWRVKAANNRIIAIGGEGFHNMADAAHIADSVTGNRLRIDYL